MRNSLRCFCYAGFIALLFFLSYIILIVSTCKAIDRLDLPSGFFKRTNQDGIFANDQGEKL